MLFRSIPALRLASVLALVTVLAVILYESSQARGQPGVIELTTNEAYAGHFTVYAIMVFCAMAVLGRATLIGAASVLLLATSLGVAMELYQALEPSRTASAADALANAAGAAFGIIAFLLAGALLDSRGRQPTKP